jgi:hypothetical protein
MKSIMEVRAASSLPASDSDDRKLEVIVLFTTPAETVRALKSSAKLAEGLSARIRLVVPHVVPFPLPIDQPSIDPNVLSRGISAMVREAGVQCTGDIRICRDPWDAIKQALPSRSVVVIGTKPPWWRRSARKLSGLLIQEGHQIAYADAGDSHA